MTDGKPNIVPGVPIWVDLSTSDVEGAKAFYKGLFGWESDMVPDPAAGGYGMFRSKGKIAAGVGPSQNPQMPPVWTTYIGTDDADAMARAVREAGGNVIMEPFDVMGQGRMAVFQDPSGAFVSAWQPILMAGAEVSNEPNSWTWNELLTRDMGKAKPFYQKAFGWGVKEQSMGQGGPSYTEWQVNGRTVAGGMDMPPNVPAEVPSNWAVYFGVDDCDAAVEKVKQLGGRVMMPCMDTPAGRFAAVTDPQGAFFNVIKLTRSAT
jgi:uncharacterized protein